jgi:hypothetical protein
VAAAAVVIAVFLPQIHLLVRFDVLSAVTEEHGDLGYNAA